MAHMLPSRDKHAFSSLSGNFLLLIRLIPRPLSLGNLRLRLLLYSKPPYYILSIKPFIQNKPLRLTRCLPAERTRLDAAFKRPFDVKASPIFSLFLEEKYKARPFPINQVISS